MAELLAGAHLENGEPRAACETLRAVVMWLRGILLVPAAPTPTTVARSRKAATTTKSDDGSGLDASLRSSMAASAGGHGSEIGSSSFSGSDDLDDDDYAKRGWDSFDRPDRGNVQLPPRVMIRSYAQRLQLRLGITYVLVGASAPGIDTLRTLIAEEEALARRGQQGGGGMAGLGLGLEGHGLVFRGGALQRQIVLWSWLAKAHLENDDSPQCLDALERLKKARASSLHHQVKRKLLAAQKLRKEARERAAAAANEGTGAKVAMPPKPTTPKSSPVTRRSARKAVPSPPGLPSPDPTQPGHPQTSSEGAPRSKFYSLSVDDAGGGYGGGRGRGGGVGGGAWAAAISLDDVNISAATSSKPSAPPHGAAATAHDGARARPGAATPSTSLAPASAVLVPPALQVQSQPLGAATTVMAWAALPVQPPGIFAFESLDLTGGSAAGAWQLGAASRLEPCLPRWCAAVQNADLGELAARAALAGKRYMRALEYLIPTLVAVETALSTARSSGTASEGGVGATSGGGGAMQGGGGDARDTAGNMTVDMETGRVIEGAGAATPGTPSVDVMSRSGATRAEAGGRAGHTGGAGLGPGGGRGGAGRTGRTGDGVDGGGRAGERAEGRAADMSFIIGGRRAAALRQGGQGVSATDRTSGPRGDGGEASGAAGSGRGPGAGSAAATGPGTGSTVMPLEGLLELGRLYTLRGKIQHAAAVALPSAAYPFQVRPSSKKAAVRMRRLLGRYLHKGGVEEALGGSVHDKSDPLGGPQLLSRKARSVSAGSDLVVPAPHVSYC